MEFEEWDNETGKTYGGFSQKEGRRRAWQASAGFTRKKVVEEVIAIIRSLPCIGCDLKDRSHFSDCPKYNEEWLVGEITSLDAKLREGG